MPERGTIAQFIKPSVQCTETVLPVTSYNEVHGFVGDNNCSYELVQTRFRGKRVTLK
jgi:hypothetical protein